MTLPAPIRAVIVSCLVAQLVVTPACSRAAVGPENENDQQPTEVAVHVATVQRTTLRAYITGYGRVAAEPATVGRPASQVMVTSTVAGRVVEAPFVEGQTCEAGAVLFQLDSRLAEIAVDNARRHVEFAQNAVDRQHALARAEGTSMRLVLEAEQALGSARSELDSAAAQRDLLRITAPISGTVTRMLVKAGQAIDPSTGLAELTAADRIVVVAAIPNGESAGLAPGQSAEISVAGAAMAATGTVTLISPQVETSSDTVAVRVALPSGTGLRIGQFVRARVVSEQHPDCLAVPVESVVRTADTTIIAIVEGNTARQRVVRVGLRDGALVEVESEGLKEGMTVVTSGTYGLPEGATVKVLGPR